MLKEEIKSDLNKSVKEKNEVMRSVLRMLLASILNKEKEKKYKTSKEELTEEEVLEVILSEVKKRKEAILEYEKGKRQDLVEREKAEIEVLKRYLPEQLSEKEIKDLVEETIKRIGAKEKKDIGRVMAEIMPKVKGRSDGGTVSKIVKELLS